MTWQRWIGVDLVSPPGIPLPCMRICERDMCGRACMRVSMCLYVRAHANALLHTHTHTHARKHTHTHLLAHISIHLHARTQRMYTRQGYARDVQDQPIHFTHEQVFAFVCTCVRACAHACVRVCVRACVFVWLRACVRAFVCAPFLVCACIWHVATCVYCSSSLYRPSRTRPRSMHL